MAGRLGYEGIRFGVDWVWNPDIHRYVPTQSVRRSDVERAVKACVVASRSSRWGRSVSVVDKGGLDEVCRMLIDGNGEAGGVISAVLAALGITVASEPEPEVDDADREG